MQGLMRDDIYGVDEEDVSRFTVMEFVPNLCNPWEVSFGCEGLRAIYPHLREKFPQFEGELVHFSMKMCP